MNHPATIHVFSNGTLTCRGKTYRCALGRHGLTPAKREGDRTTPRGVFPLRACLYRPDKTGKPETGLPVGEITATTGWCDDPAHPKYNRLVTLPFAASHEALRRDDPCYDLLVTIGYNDDPIIPGKGSAVFLHLAKEGYVPTEGCVAVSKHDMLEILPALGPGSLIAIGE